MINYFHNKPNLRLVSALFQQMTSKEDIENNYYSRSLKLLNAEKEEKKFTLPLEVSLNIEEDIKEFDKYEEAGLSIADKCLFVLVAGGLGERLGHSGIKIELAMESLTNMSYLEYYITKIMAYGVKQLVIMVSRETKDKTYDFIKKHNGFGLAHIHIMEQSEVPALNDKNAEIAVKDGKLIMKPHGHGDVHQLLWDSGLLTSVDYKYIVFFQDTNALAFHAIPAALGVCEINKLDATIIGAPRRKGEAMGVLVTLEDKEKEVIANMEYNYLKDLSQEELEKYPGNTNIMIVKGSTYNEVRGQVPEFINPKYAADNVTFLSPARLECMMQDYLLLLPLDKYRVCATILPRLLCFSPVKNKSDIKNVDTKETAERDYFASISYILKQRGYNSCENSKIYLHPSLLIQQSKFSVK